MPPPGRSDRTGWNMGVGDCHLDRVPTGKESAKLQKKGGQFVSIAALGDGPGTS